MSNKNKVIIFWGISIFALVILKLFNISFALLHLGECVLKKHTGLSCIACGGTRATDALIHFNFVDAFLYNPLYIILLAFGLIYSLIISIDIFINNKKTFKFKKTTSKILTILLIVFAILFTIIRNTPFYLRFFHL